MLRGGLNRGSRAASSRDDAVADVARANAPRRAGAGARLDARGVRLQHRESAQVRGGKDPTRGVAHERREGGVGLERDHLLRAGARGLDGERAAGASGVEHHHATRAVGHRARHGGAEGVHAGGVVAKVFEHVESSGARGSSRRVSHGGVERCLARVLGGDAR